MHSEHALIKDETALEEWLRRPHRPLSFAFPELTPPENDRWANTIARHRLDCGCSAGTAAFFLSAAFYPSLAGSARFVRRERFRIQILAFPVMTIASALTGKIFGVWMADKNLKRALGLLSTELRKRRVGSAVRKATRQPNQESDVIS